RMPGSLLSTPSHRFGSWEHCAPTLLTNQVTVVAWRREHFKTSAIATIARPFRETESCRPGDASQAFHASCVSPFLPRAPGARLPHDMDLFAFARTLIDLDSTTGRERAAGDFLYAALEER